MDIVSGEPVIDIFVAREDSNGSHHFDAQDLGGNGACCRRLKALGSWAAAGGGTGAGPGTWVGA